MKKNLVLATILFLVTIYAAAQTLKTEKEAHGNYLIEGKDGKYSDVHYRGINKIVDGNFLNPSFKKMKNQTDKHERFNNENTHHLTLHFDKKNPSVNLSSNSVCFSTFDFVFSEDFLTAEIDLPENIYEGIFYFNDWEPPFKTYFVIINSLNINRDIDTVINFELMADHKIFVKCKDQNNKLLSPSDPSLLTKQLVTLDIELPENCYLGSSSYQMNLPDGYVYISDVGSKYKILLNQFNVKHGELYVTDMGCLSGISKDTTLENDPDDYRIMKMVMHASHSSDENYILINYGDIGRFGYSAFGYMMDEYPSFDNDTLVAFLSNRLHPDNQNSAFIPIVEFWEEKPTYENLFDGKKTTTAPLFVNINDSIVFSLTPDITPFLSQYADNSVADIGLTTPFIVNIGRNNKWEENTIFSYNLINGQLLERRNIDEKLSTFEIKNNEGILSSDSLLNFMEPFIVEEPGAYSFVVTDSNYFVKELPGVVTMESSFDLSKEDANAPVLTSFKAQGADKIPCTTFTDNRPATVCFYTYDWDMDNYQMNIPDFVQVYFKKNEDTEWTELNSVAYPALFDSTSLNYGGCPNSCDLSPALSQFNSSGYLDLKIVVSDEAGNSTSQIWQPLAFVQSTVRIPETPPVSATESLLLYPNPVTDVLSIDYSGSGSCSINILNAQGKLVYKSIANENEQYINLKSLNLANGIYFIQLISDSKTITKKIIYKN